MAQQTIFHYWKCGALIEEEVCTLSSDAALEIMEMVIIASKKASTMSFEAALKTMESYNTNTVFRQISNRTTVTQY